MARQAAGLIAAVLLAFAASAVAQTAPDRLKTPQTEFGTLSVEEKRVLAPIEREWARLPGYQQQRLISSARRYPSMQPIQKERFDSRIRDWAAMSPEQRKEAREAFQGLRKLPPAQQHELRERWLQRHEAAQQRQQQLQQQQQQPEVEFPQPPPVIQQQPARAGRQPLTREALEAREAAARRRALDRTREPPARTWRQPPADSPPGR